MTVKTKSYARAEQSDTRQSSDRQSAPRAAGQPQPQSVLDNIQTAVGNLALQRFAGGAPASPPPRPGPATEAALRSPAGGRPLPYDVRHKMENRFLTNLQTVRLHDDSSAARAARELNAQAFTVGRDIYFGRGHYRPDTMAGRRLLAHELAHVSQRGRRITTQPAVGSTHTVGRADSGLEREADAAARAICQGRSFVSTAVPQTKSGEADTFVDRKPAEEPPSSESAHEAAGGQAGASGRTPVKIRFDEERPWLVSAEGGAGDADIAYELYGGELSMFLERGVMYDPMQGRPEIGYAIVPELLRPPHQAHFHEAMQSILERDVRRIKDILFEIRIDADDENMLVHYISWWADRKDLRTETGQSYFDALLARLKQDEWYRDYGLWEGESAPFLDLLYTEVEERQGEIHALIAQNSVELGGYRPTWTGFKPTGEPKEETPSAVNREVVEKTTEMILDRLVGPTSEDDSKIITDALTGLPAPEQAAVLMAMMSRHDEADWTGIFGRFGEAWKGGMLYYLFEDLSEDDAQRVAEALKTSGVLPPETVGALLAGRGWGGKYLPYTTYKAHEAAEYWAGKTVEATGADAIVPALAGGAASLWLPETAASTVLTLAAARVLPRAAKIHPVVGGGLMVVGTGLLTFTTALAVQDLITGKNSWTGQPLGYEDKIARILVVGSGILLLGATALVVSAAAPGRGAPPSTRVRGVRVMTDEEVIAFKKSHVRVPIEDMPPGQELWVPKGSPAARMAHQAGLVTERALVPIPRSTTLVPTGGAQTSGMLPASQAPVGKWISLGPLPAATLGTATIMPPAVPQVRPPLALPAGDTFGSYMSNESLDMIESHYGLAVRNSTATAQTYADLRTIADSLGGYRNQYLGTVGEMLSADVAVSEGVLAVRPHGTSTEPGPDVPTVTAEGPPEIILREAKMGASERPYRIGESGFPAVYRDPVGLYEYIWGIIRNPQLPKVTRARFKVALDEGRISWQLDTHGNVRVKVRGCDAFPGDIEVATPVRLPLTREPSE